MFLFQPLNQDGSSVPSIAVATASSFESHEPLGTKLTLASEGSVAIGRNRVDEHDFILVFVFYKHLVSAQTWTGHAGIDDVSPRSRPVSNPQLKQTTVNCKY